MAKIVYRQMPAPRDLPQQISAPGRKLGCKSPEVEVDFRYNPRGCVGEGMVMAKIDSCITSHCIALWALHFHADRISEKVSKQNQQNWVHPFLS